MPKGRGSNLKDRELYEELRKRAKELGLTGYSGKKKSELISMLRNH